MGAGDERWKGNSKAYQQGQESIFGFDCLSCNNRGCYVAKDTTGLVRVECPCTKNPDSRFNKRRNKDGS